MTELGPLALDAETMVQAVGVSERPHKPELRLWLRMLTCTNLVEALVRTRLRAEFGATLPRFDLMAQLERSPEGMTLGQLSRRMMVSNGNVTGLVERLVEMGLVERLVDPADRRTATVRLTAEGRGAFAAMARAHEGWLAEAFAGLGIEDRAALMGALGRLKASVQEVQA